VRALLHTEFAALLARANVSQAAFARLSGYTPRQVNNWARGRAAAPHWAIALAAVLQQTSPEAIQIMLEEITFAMKPSACRQTPTPRRSGGPWLGWR
jgi:transcriptional regulator with XRE-family HTH domain